MPTCAEAGILGALTGIVGSLQAMEVLKLVGGFGEPLLGRLLYDGPCSGSRRCAIGGAHDKARRWIDARTFGIARA